MSDKLSFCRLAWNIVGHGKGNGEWLDNTPENVSYLEVWRDSMNQKYGSGSHRIEYDDGESSSSVTQEVLKRVSPKTSGTLESGPVGVR